jgi:RHS repeat-associated protein
VRQDTPNSNPAGKTPFEKDLYFYHPDHLGASNYITDLNAKLYEHLEYFPFGEAWVEENSNTQRTPYLFTAKELDEETGLYYFGARYYDPRTSVWQSADPILGKYLPDMVKIENKLNKKRKETDGQTGMLDIAQKLPVLASWSPKEELPGGGVFNSLNLNLYAYSYQNPVVYNDPTGLAPPIEQATPLAVTSGFGQRNIPQSPNAFHYGADLRAPVGTEARAVSPGVVVRAGNASGGSRVIIRHDDGSYTWTRHINPSVQQGQRVGENDVIGRTCTGGSCGTNEPHLHFERQAPGATAKTNPVPFIRQEEAAAAAARSQTP